ncbi:hypothetical protein N0V90_006789 [Kalmusia sp. IMI 367209]|nr:hypothetical protein N0V90_006789 [Kalmusia sp. IMI 367209]
MEQTTIWIILAVVLGSLVLAMGVVLILFCWRRSKKRVRGFSLRAVTPLDDAEFESWRRPSQYTQRPQKYGIRPTKPLTVRTTQTPIMFEKGADVYDAPHTPPLRDDPSFNYPMSPIRKPEQASNAIFTFFQDNRIPPLVIHFTKVLRRQSPHSLSIDVGSIRLQLRLERYESRFQQIRSGPAFNTFGSTPKSIL